MPKEDVPLGSAQLRTEEDSLDPELVLGIFESPPHLRHLDAVLLAEGEEDMRLDQIREGKPRVPGIGPGDELFPIPLTPANRVRAAGYPAFQGSFRHPKIVRGLGNRVTRYLVQIHRGGSLDRSHGFYYTSPRPQLPISMTSSNARRSSGSPSGSHASNPGLPKSAWSPG